MVESKLFQAIIVIFIPAFLVVATIVMFNNILFEDSNWGGTDIDCEFGAFEMYGNIACSPPPCKTYNIDGKDCVREGYTGSGFLGLTDWSHEYYVCEYYVCEGYGRIALSCIDYYESVDELLEDYNMNKMEDK